MAWAEDNSLLLRATLLGDVRYVDEPLLRKRIGGVSNPDGKPVIDSYFAAAEATNMHRIAAVNAFLLDVYMADPSLQGPLMRACHRRLGPLKFESALRQLSQPPGLAILPVALLRPLITLHLGYVGAALKHVFPDAYIAHRRRRYEAGQ